MITSSLRNRVVNVTGASGGGGRTHAPVIARRGGAVLASDPGGRVEGT